MLPIVPATRLPSSKGSHDVSSGDLPYAWLAQSLDVVEIACHQIPGIKIETSFEQPFCEAFVIWMFQGQVHTRLENYSAT